MKLTQKMKAARKIRESCEKVFKEKFISQLGDHLVVGQEFLEDFKQQNTYYSGFGFNHYSEEYRDKLVGLLQVNDSRLGYFATCTSSDDKDYCAVFLIDDQPSQYEENFENEYYRNWVEKNVVALYFLGCDDTSHSKRFKDEQSALAYLKKHNTLDAVIEDSIGNDLWIDFIKKTKKEKYSDVLQQEANNILDSFLNVEN